MWWAICFKIVDSKNAVCALTNRDYIDSMVNKIDSTCTTGVHRLGFMKIDSNCASITHGGENRVDSCHIPLVFAKKKLIIICLLMFQLLNLNGDHHCTHCMSLNFNPHFCTFFSQYYESQSGLTQY